MYEIQRARVSAVTYALSRKISVKDLIISAASKAFADVFTKDDVVFVYFKVEGDNFRAVFHEADRIFRVRLFRLLGLDPIFAPVDRRDGVLQYFGAVNAVSHLSEGWLKLDLDSSVCCQAEIVLSSGVQFKNLDELIPMMVNRAGNTLARWWPGLAAVINDGMARSGRRRIRFVINRVFLRGFLRLFHSTVTSGFACEESTWRFTGSRRCD